MPEQDYLSPRRPARSWLRGSSGEVRARARDDDEEYQAPPPGRQRRAPGSRAMRTAARKRRRWLAGLAALVAAGAAAVAAVLLSGGSNPAQVTPNALITAFLPGELRQVPNACGTVPAATVQRYLPGKVKTASPLPVNGSAESDCNWTLNSPPAWRLLELDIFAYAPSGLASGDGSATNAAKDAYAAKLHGMQKPPPRSPAPRAAVTALTALGDQAFGAMQVFRSGGSVTDVASVVVRYHNVLVTVTLNGLQKSNRGSYGPVSKPQLSAAALAFAQAAVAALH